VPQRLKTSGKLPERKENRQKPPQKGASMVNYVTSIVSSVVLRFVFNSVASFSIVIEFFRQRKNLESLIF
jgi:hypothetical protein